MKKVIVFIAVVVLLFAFSDKCLAETPYHGKPYHERNEEVQCVKCGKKFLLSANEINDLKEVACPHCGFVQSSKEAYKMYHEPFIEAQQKQIREQEILRQKQEKTRREEAERRKKAEKRRIAELLKDGYEIKVNFEKEYNISGGDAPEYMESTLPKEASFAVNEKTGEIIASFSNPSIDSIVDFKIFGKETGILRAVTEGSDENPFVMITFIHFTHGEGDFYMYFELFSSPKILYGKYSVSKK